MNGRIREAPGADVSSAHAVRGLHRNASGLLFIRRSNFMMLSFDTVWRRLRRNGEHAPQAPAAGLPADTDPQSEAPWLAHLDKANIPRHLKYPSTTLGRILDQSADRFGDTEAVGGL